MFAVIYRGYLKEGKEEEYQRLWRKIAKYFMASRGAIGSCLHRTEDGMWVAYSRWPSKKARDAAWPGKNDPSRELPADIRETILAIKDCVDETRSLPEIAMEVVDDLLRK